MSELLSIRSVSPVSSASADAVSEASRFRPASEPLRRPFRENAPAVTAHVRPAPKALDEAGLETVLSRVQEEAGPAMVGAHSGLDPQRVAKLLGLSD